LILQNYHNFTSYFLKFEIVSFTDHDIVPITGIAIIAIISSILAAITARNSIVCFVVVVIKELKLAKI
jgi:hypothetical protein